MGQWKQGAGITVVCFLALLSGLRIVVRGSVVSYLDQCELEQDVALEAAILSDDED